MNREEMMYKLQYDCRLRPDLIDESKEVILTALIWHCKNRDAWIESYYKLEKEYEELKAKYENKNS